MLTTLFYYYHLFYKNVIKEGDSYFTAVLAFSASECFLTFAIVNIISAYLFCYKLSANYLLGIAIIFLILNLKYFLKETDIKRIELEKPAFFSNSSFSALITFLFFIITTSTLFWLSGLINSILHNNCN